MMHDNCRCWIVFICIDAVWWYPRRLRHFILTIVVEVLLIFRFCISFWRWIWHDFTVYLCYYRWTCWSASGFSCLGKDFWKTRNYQISEWEWWRSNNAWKIKSRSGPFSVQLWKLLQVKLWLRERGDCFTILVALSIFLLKFYWKRLVNRVERRVGECST